MLSALKQKEKAGSSFIQSIDTLMFSTRVFFIFRRIENKCYFDIPLTKIKNEK